MTSLSCAQDSAQAAQVLGARFMLDPTTFGRGVELGLPKSMASYVMGRMGVIGDISAQEATDAAWCINFDMINENWVDDLVPSAAGALYAQICVEQGRKYLDGFAGAARLAELAGRIADAADDTDAALFAGWRDAARPDDAEGLAYLLVQVVRELRFCRHATAARVAGVSPSSLVQAKNGGSNVAIFGWGDSTDQPADSQTVTDIETATEAAAALDHSVLNEDEQTEYVGLLTAALAHAEAQN
ncbi:MAG: hypothetical protein OSA06_01295 [Acidimicrobiales bacterium]|nr:hypothetical protein [Acidimicrobiales bacterium]